MAESMLVPGCAGRMIGPGERKWMEDPDGSGWKQAQEEDCQAIGV